MLKGIIYTLIPGAVPAGFKVLPTILYFLYHIIAYFIYALSRFTIKDIKLYVKAVSNHLETKYGKISE